MLPSISLIIPVYNAADYIVRCLESIMAQTFKDYEVLLVDDGSKDASGQICDEYAKEYVNIHTIHQINGGVSSARQTGLDNSTGEYVIFVDPDDWVEPTMLEDLYSKIVETNADMVITDFFVNTIYGQKYVNQQPSSLNSKSVLHDLFEKLHGSCCNKLVKHKCFLDYDVRFPIGVNYMEDFFVNVSLLLNPLKIAYLNHAYYHYVIGENTNSLSLSFGKENYMERRKLLDMLEPLLKDVYPKGLSILKIDLAIWLLETHLESRKNVLSILEQILNFKFYLQLSNARKAKLLIGLLLGSKSRFVHRIITNLKNISLCK